jgi:hypothetical protein
MICYFLLSELSGKDLPFLPSPFDLGFSILAFIPLNREEFNNYQVVI